MSNQDYSVSQAAEILDCSKSTVRRKIRNGDFEGAYKKKTRYGEQWFISKEDINQALMKNETIEVKEVNQPVDKEELLNELVEAVNSQNKQLINESMKKVSNKLDKQNEHIQEQKRAIEDLSEQMKEMQEQYQKELKELKEQQNRNLWDKVKNLFR